MGDSANRDEPVRAVIFGNGFARTVMLPALRHVDAIEIVGIASPNQTRLRQTAKEFGIPRFGPDHQDLLAETEPDLAIIATPPHRHLDQSRDALAAGCHVLCEKPTALDADESAQMLEVSRAHPDRLALIDHELRLDPKRVEVRRLVDDGTIGRVLRASYTVTSGSRRDPEGPWTWLSDASVGGGALGALGSHAVDSLRSVLGEVNVEATTGRLSRLVDVRTDAEGERRPVTADEAAEGSLQFEGGAEARVFVSQLERERIHRMVLEGELGTIVWNEKEPLRIGSRGREREHPVVDDLPPSAELKIPDTEWARCFLRLSREIASTIQSGTTTVEGAATFTDGHANQRILDAIRSSSGD